MNDRLGELTGGSGGGGGSNVAPFEIAIDINDTGDGGSGGGGGASFMEGFFDKVNAVKKDIDAVKKACTDLDTLTQKAALSSNAAVESDTKSLINTTIANTNNRVAHAKGLLQAMREETEGMKKDPARAKPSEVRVRENLQNTLTRKFVDVAKDYQNRQNNYKTTVKEKTKRLVLAVKKTATEEELEAVFEQEDGGQQVLRAAILHQGDPVEVTRALEEVKDTYHDVRRLEASILELHKMFMDLALLVDRQGEMLDQIEYQVKSASDYVKDANTDIEHAIESSKKIRKRQCCIIIIVLAVIAVLVIVFLVKSASDYVKDANTDIEHAIESSKKIRKRQCCMIIIVLAVIAAIVILLLATGAI